MTPGVTALSLWAFALSRFGRRLMGVLVPSPLSGLPLRCAMASMAVRSSDGVLVLSGIAMGGSLPRLIYPRSH